MKQHHTIKKSILNIRHVLLKAMKFVMILNVVQGFFYRIQSIYSTASNLFILESKYQIF